MRVIAYGFLIFIGLTLLILPAAVPVIKTSAEFSIFNTKWNGCSKFAKALHEKGDVIPILYSYNSVNVGELRGVLIVIGPDIPFSELEAREVQEFLKNGGTLFIADDFGTANSLLEKLGVKARFSSVQLKDLFYAKNGNFPIVVRFNDPKLAADRVVLNIPSAVINAKGEIYTSKVSVLGKNMRSYPILAEIKYEKGRIILLSDPSILINDMFEENKQFIEKLVDYLGSGNFYVDEAHHYDFNPYSISTVYVHKEISKENMFNVFLIVACIAVIVESGVVSKVATALWTKVIGAIIRKREEIEFTDLPEWVDREKFKKMVEEMKNGSKLRWIYERKKVYGKTEKRD
jgi:hypothetical protein